MSRCLVLLAVVAVMPLANQAGADSPPLAFVGQPAVAREGQGARIRFQVSRATDVQVCVIDADGRVVRHLAAGLLGPNAPDPLTRNALTQDLVWDGRSDATTQPGRAIRPPLRVRIGLGLAAVFDHAMGWSTHQGRGEILGVGCDPAGLLYVLLPGPQVRVYDRKGEYLRTILPPPAAVAPQRMTLIDWTATSWGGLTVCRPRSGGSSAFDLCRFPGMDGAFDKQSLAAVPPGRLTLVSGFVSWQQKLAGRKLILLDARDGAVPGGSIIDLDRSPGPGRMGPMGSGRAFVACSPDGKTLYFSGLGEAGRWPSVVIHAVFRLPLDRGGPAEPFLGDPKTAGGDDAHFDQPRGVACDSAGRVYVADYGNDRIQVFQPAAGGPDAAGSAWRLVKSIPTSRPDQLLVHPRTGAIYVLTGAKDEKRMHFAMELTRLGGLDRPTVEATLKLPVSQFSIRPIIALDATSDPPAVWIGSANGRWPAGVGLWRVEDRTGKEGGRLEKVLDLADRPGPAGWDAWNPQGRHGYVFADPFREEIYVREGDTCFPSPLLRVDGRTGRVIERFPLPVEQAAVAPDGSVWMRVTDAGRWLVRYDPDAHTFVAIPGGQPVMQRNYQLKHAGQALVGVFVPATAGARTWQDVMGVAPNGELYVPAAIAQEHLAALERAGLPRPPKVAGTANCVLSVLAADGRLKALSVLPGLGHCGAVRVGRRGQVYISLQCHPAGQKLPDGIAPDGKWFCAEWGTLVKFDSRFDEFPVATVAGRWGDKAQDPTHIWGAQYAVGQGERVRLDRVAWQYGGVCPLTQGGCTCLNSTFDLDGYERSFVPAAQTCSVNVLDSNGNLLARLGGYGNCDDRGPRTGRGTGPGAADERAVPTRNGVTGPDLPLSLPQFVAVTDQAVYVFDRQNARIVRAVLSHAVQETLAIP